MIRLALVIILLFLAPHASAHDARPLVVKITLVGRDARVRWEAPPSVDPQNAPLVSIAAPCVARISGAPAIEGRALYDCPKGLGPVMIHYGAYDPSLSTIVRIDRGANGAETAVLGPAQSVYVPKPTPTFTSIARSYFILGVGHILSGIDHLLFLGGLLLLARTIPRILMTVTGFTIAHSATLILVALDVVRVSIPAIEATIALSIVFVAAEVARGDRLTLAWRRPILVASTFGLLHGAGFAAALGEIGLPTTERVAGLLSFNIGVEAGQLAVVAALLALVALLRRLRRAAGRGLAFPPTAERVAGYALGVTSGFWLVERVALAVGSGRL